MAENKGRGILKPTIKNKKIEDSDKLKRKRNILIATSVTSTILVILLIYIIITSTISDEDLEIVRNMFKQGID